MNSEYKSIQKETIVDYLMYYADIRLQRRRKITRNLSQDSWSNNQFLMFFGPCILWIHFCNNSSWNLFHRMILYAKYDVTDVCCSR
jgi:hypothetical protein